LSDQAIQQAINHSGEQGWHLPAESEKVGD